MALVGILAFIILSPVAFAQDYFQCTGPNPPDFCNEGGGGNSPCGGGPGVSPAARQLCIDLSNEDSVINIILRIIGLIRTIFWILVVLMILYSAYLYLIEGASGGKVEKANQMLKYTIIAIIIALIATSVPYLVKSILT